MNEKHLKCALIDYLMENYPTALLIGVEIPFISMRRRVDVLMITEEKQLIAFEIKSDQDNLTRLNGQISDYKKTFDKLYIVTSNKYKNICKMIPNGIGCLYCNDQTIKILRESKTIKRLSKKNLSFFIQQSDFQMMGYKNLSIIDARKKIINSTTTDLLRNFAINSILKRYSKR